MANQTNSTTVVVPTVDQSDDVISDLRIVMDILIMSLTAILMLSFGCSIRIKDIKYQVTKPISVSVAMLCHFVLVPYIFYGLKKAVQFNPHDAASLMILSTCPAGGVANIYVDWAEGDIALGIIVTALSTLIGLVFMPLNFWMFGGENQSQFLPYVETVISLASTLLPVAIGMAILKWHPRVAKWVSRAGSVLGGVLVLATIGLSSYMYPGMYRSGWKTWLIAAIYSPTSFLIGYVITLAMRMPAQVRRTIAITTSVKSIALCLTIVTVSFPADTYVLSLVFPELHSIMMLAQLAVICVLYRITRCCQDKYFMELDLDNLDSSTTLDSDITDAATVDGGGYTVQSERDGIYSVPDRNRHVTRRMSDGHALQSGIALSLFSSHL